MPLGSEGGLDTGDIVLVGTQLPYGKVYGSPPPTFRPTVLARTLISATAELLLYSVTPFALFVSEILRQR